MNVLLNYATDDKPYLDQFAFMLRGRNINAFSTVHDMSMGQLMLKAKQAGVDAILISNQATLSQIVHEDKPTIDNWRGTRLNFSTPAIIINKLSHINTVNHGRWLLEKDLDKLAAIRKPAQKFSFEKLTSTKYFNDAFADLIQAEFLYHDIETRTLSQKKDSLEVGRTVITCCAWTGVFKNGQLRTYVLPLINFDKTYWDTDEEYAKALMFMRLVNKSKLPKGMHHGTYDAIHTICYHAEPVNYVYDTMVAAHSEYAELPKDLAFVASYQLYDYINWKGDAERTSKSRDIEGYWGYNAKDTWHGARITLRQLETMPAYAIHNYATKFKLIYPSLYANFEGFKIDQAARLESRTEAEKKLKEAEAALRVQVADPNFNPGSWQQKQKILYNIFGAKHPHVGKSSSGTDEKNLLVVATQHPILARLVTNILQYMENQKAIGTYYDYLQFKGRLLWALNPFGAETERFTCSASSLWCGTQVQNIPGYAKHTLVADEGMEIFEADEKQAEGRTTAYVSQELNLISALEDAEKDFYKVLATMFFQIPYVDVTDFFRNKVIKKIVHGTNYMMGPKTFIENAGIMVLYEAAQKLGIFIVPVRIAGSDKHMTLKEFAKSLLDVYHKPFPRIREWYQEIKTELIETGYLVSPVGHTRKFFGNVKTVHQIFMGAVAHQPQNLSGHVLNIGYDRCYKEIVIPNNGKFRLKAQIHDSILGQWPMGYADVYAPKVLECMDNPIMVHGRRMSIPIDLKYGQNWAEASDSNPNGTKKWKAKT